MNVEKVHVINTLSVLLLTMFAIGLLLSCTPSSFSPQENLRFANGRVDLIVQTAGLQLPVMVNLVDIVWDAQGNLILAGNYPIDQKNNTCVAGSVQNSQLAANRYCSFVAKLRLGKTEWIFVQPDFTLGITVDQNNHIIVASENTLFKLSSSGQILWEKALVQVYALYVTLDQENNIFVAGDYKNPAKLGSYIFPTNISSSNWFTNFFIKLAPDGSLLWAETKAENFTTLQRHAVAVDKEGNIAVLGQPLPSSYAIKGDFVIIKLDKGKNMLWITSIDDFVNLARYDIKHDIKYNYLINRSKQITFDQEGNLFVVLSFFSFRSYESICDQMLMLVIKISKEGKPLWSNKITFCTTETSSKESWITNIKTDRQNHAYLVGTIEKDSRRMDRFDTEEPVRFGKTPVIPQRRISPFVAKLSPNGEFVWSHVFDVYARAPFETREHFPHLFVFDIRQDNSNTMAFAGIFWGDATFPTTPSTSLKGSRDIFVFTANLESVTTVPQSR